MIGAGRGREVEQIKKKKEPSPGKNGTEKARNPSRNPQAEGNPENSKLKLSKKKFPGGTASLARKHERGQPGSAMCGGEKMKNTWKKSPRHGEKILGPLKKKPGSTKILPAKPPSGVSPFGRHYGERNQWKKIEREKKKNPKTVLVHGGSPGKLFPSP